MADELSRPVLIHVSARFYDVDQATEAFIADALGRLFLCELSENHAPLGGIVGIADVVDCVESHASPWFVGPFGFVLENARTLPFVPLAGKLSFFRC